MPETQFLVSRSNPRFSFIAEAELAELEEGTRIVARISELSSRGCYVDTVNPFPEGTKLSIRIRYGCSTCQLSGKVIYTHTGYGMGVHFADIAKENRTTLDAWLEELARKSN
jgi:hypothetical protein